jgi:hypothetical protein
MKRTPEQLVGATKAFFSWINEREFLDIAPRRGTNNREGDQK